MARRLVPLMTKIVPSNDMAREAVERLQSWDFHMDADKVEPLLFTAWLRAFARSVLFARLGEPPPITGICGRVMEAVLTQRPIGAPTRSSRAARPARRVSPQALDTALDELRRAYGNEMAQWQWGRAHIAYFPNAVFERVPLLRDWLRVTIPTPGATTRSIAGPSSIRDDAHPYEQRFGAGLRIITDLAAPADRG
jgi:penicillin amidase